LLVADYKKALEYAKDYNLTCITPKLEVVYAGAFMSKVGYYNTNESNRVQIYSKVA
jgi:hypothetical protein